MCLGSLLACLYEPDVSFRASTRVSLAVASFLIAEESFLLSSNYCN